MNEEVKSADEAVTPAKPVVVLNNWAKLSWLGGDVLVGDAFGHPRFPDGTEIRSSRIVEERDGEIETRNTVYKLGEPYLPKSQTQ